MSIRKNNQTIAGTYSATTTASIAPSTDRNYVTDAEKVLISNLYFKPTYTITVGTGGDFALLSEALAYAANYSAVKIIISLSEDITEPSEIILAYLNSSTIVIEGNGHVITITDGRIKISYCTNIVVQNITINTTSTNTIEGMSLVFINNSTITCSSTTATGMYVQTLACLHSYNSTYNSSTSAQYARGFMAIHGASVHLSGNNTVNYLNGISEAFYIECANVYLSGTLKIYGKSGITTNTGLYLTQGSFSASYATTLTITNCRNGVFATSSSRFASNIASFTVTPSGVTTLYTPAKNTLGNYNSYIQVP